MNKNELRKIINDCCNDVWFVYNGKKSGITSEVKNYVPKFQAWHGDSIKYYDNVNDVMNDDFYSGKSLIELIDSGEDIDLFIS